jgi:hypothetical protein
MLQTATRTGSGGFGRSLAINMAERRSLGLLNSEKPANYAPAAKNYEVA